MSHLLLAIVTTTVLLSSLFYASLFQNSYSQIRTKNNEQLWTDSDHDLKIKFVYEPKIPIVDKPTELKFAVQRISTGDYLRNLEANVLVTDNISGQFRDFRFNNVSASGGQFSVKYLFPDTGLFEIIVRTSSPNAPDAQALTAFDVIVSKK
jgi:hypothetical protein